MKKFNLYIIILLLFIPPKIRAQLNEFMIQSEFYLGEHNQDAGPWVTDPDGFFRDMKNTNNFNTISFTWINDIPKTARYVSSAYDANLKTMVWLRSELWDSSIVEYDSYYASEMNALNKVTGFFVKDEATPENFPSISNYSNKVRMMNSSLLCWTNLFGGYGSDQFYRENYIQKLIDLSSPSFLSFDYYPTWGGIRPNYFSALYDLALKSVENSIPFMVILTPFKSGDDFYKVQPSPLEAKGMAEFNYDIYAALAYGAKGIIYWPGFQWVPNSYWTNNGKGPLENGGYLFKLDYSTATLDHLRTLHNTLIEHSTELLSLNFVSAYHKSFSSTISDNSLDIIHNFCSWDNFRNDACAKLVFKDTGNPLDTETPSLAITFLTNSSGEIYFWLFNKDLKESIIYSAGFFNGSIITNVLNGEILNAGTKPGIILAPGEAHLYKTTFVLPNIQITNKDYTRNDNGAFDVNFYPFESYNQITLGGDGSNVSFDSGITKSFMGHNIIINKGVTINKGSIVRLKGYKDSNTINTTAASENTLKNTSLLKSKGITQVEKIDNDKEVSIFPNPAKDYFVVNGNFSGNEKTEILLYNAMGELVKAVKATNGKTSISFQEQPAGVYLVNFVCNNRAYKYKVVKQ